VFAKGIERQHLFSMHDANGGDGRRDLTMMMVMMIIIIVIVAIMRVMVVMVALMGGET
jgi:heme/copper-type cytochrome/quinol oxidase subunit 2